MNYTNFNYNINTKTKYYANIKDNKIIGSGARLLNEDILNIPITAEIAKNIQNYKFVAPDKIIPKTEDEIQVEKAKEERERLDNLSMTRGDVFEALILAKGIGKAQLREMIEQAEIDETTKLLYLNRFDEALEFYRGYPIFNLLDEKLDITSEMLDEFFQTKDYKRLILKEPEKEGQPTAKKSSVTENKR